MAALCCLMTLGFVSQASAYYETQTITIDILDLFDTNNSGTVNFGDSNSDGYSEDQNVTKYFTLEALDGLTELVGSTATMTISYASYDPSSKDCDAYVSVNGSKLGNLKDTSSNTQSWSISLSSLNFGSSNSVLMHVAYFDKWYGEHYEDYVVTSWTLTYTVEVWVDDPVVETPVPAAIWLMGSGLLGLAGIRRRRK